MSNSVELDEKAHYEPSPPDYCCLQKPIIIDYGSERGKQISKVSSKPRECAG